jgi:hypothetical protein
MSRHFVSWPASGSRPQFDERLALMHLRVGVLVAQIQQRGLADAGVDAAGGHRLAHARAHLATRASRLNLVDIATPVARSLGLGHNLLMPHDPHPHDHSELSRQLRDSRQELAHAKLLIDKLKTEIAYLRRMHFGRSSEQLDALARWALVGRLPSIKDQARTSTTRLPCQGFTAYGSRHYAPRAPWQR